MILEVKHRYGRADPVFKPRDRLLFAQNRSVFTCCNSGSVYAFLRGVGVPLCVVFLPAVEFSFSSPMVAQSWLACRMMQKLLDGFQQKLV